MAYKELQILLGKSVRWRDVTAPREKRKDNEMEHDSTAIYLKSLRVQRVAQKSHFLTLYEQLFTGVLQIELCDL